MSLVNKTSDCLQFLKHVGKLKHLKRTGWVLRNVHDPETVSGHMYRMAMMTFLIEDTTLDRVRCLEMSLVHDLGECIIGDITPYCGISQEVKQKKELEAISMLTRLIGKRGDYVKGLFEEYEAQVTGEAKLVKELDMFDMVLQAFEYEKIQEQPAVLQEFFDSTKEKFKHPEIIRFLEGLHKEREHHLSSGS